MNQHRYEFSRSYRVVWWSTISHFTNLLTTDRFDRFAAAVAAAAAARHNVVADGLVARTESCSFLVVGNGAKGTNTQHRHRSGKGGREANDKKTEKKNEKPKTKTHDSVTRMRASTCRQIAAIEYSGGISRLRAVRPCTVRTWRAQIRFRRRRRFSFYGRPITRF